MTHTSLAWDPSFRTEADDVSASVFYGLGADGTVGANKNSIKIIGQETDLYAQGYFVYDSKKSGAITVSHLRIEPAADPLGVPRGSRQLRRLPSVRVRGQDRRARARRAGRGVPAERAVRRRRGLGSACRARCRNRSSRRRSASSRSTPTTSPSRPAWAARINTIMQTCFFAISGLLPRDEAIAHIKKSIEKTYGKRGPEVVRRNCEVVDQALAHLHEIPVPAAVDRHAHAAAARLRTRRPISSRR